MGRAGAGGGASHSTGRVHSVSHSSGSGHRMTSSRPSMSSSSVRSSSPSRSHSSVSNRVNTVTSTPRTPRPTPPPPPRVSRPTSPPPRVHVDPVMHRSPPPPPRKPSPTIVVNNYGSGGYSGTRRNTYSSSYNRGYNPTSYRSTSYNRSSNNIKRELQRKLISAITITVVVFLCIIFITALSGSNQDYKSTIQRTKLTGVQPYLNDCVIDELDWINNPSKLSSNLKKFYNDTGLQPFIYMRAYDANLYTEDDMEAFAADWFEENLYEKGYTNGLLYIYFADYDQDNVVGYMVLQHGQRAGEIMDSEAEEIFWNYLDAKWVQYDEDHTDEMFVDIFTSTSDTIMKVSTTGKDIVKWIIVLVVVLVLIVGIIVIMTKKRNNEKEKAAETERILNSSMDELIKTQEDKDLLEKYKDNNS